MSERMVVRSHKGDYDVQFVGDFSAVLTGRYAESFFLIDRNILDLYRSRIEGELPAERILAVQATEFHKTIDYCQQLIRELVARNVRRNDALVSVGGGITQDITAFIASILFRGVDWIFFPTTLLAQADSCIGSKVSINLDGYKNLVGGFYPPRRIVCDVQFLQTLPAQEVKSGIGEILHYLLISDSPMTDDLVENYEALVANPVELLPYIHTSLEIKRRMIEIDEFDRKQRRVFNYGHTFGHAIESISNYGINHGQAITMGMDIANYVSCELGYLDPATYTAMRQTLTKNMPDFTLKPIELPDYLAALAKDKKNREDNVGCVLTRGPGRMELVQLPLDDRFRALVAAYFRIPAS